MSDDARDVLEVLRYELTFLEQGGYRAQKNPLVPISQFQDSLSCINYGLPRRPHTCKKCLLWDFVPEQFRREDIPCHFIPLTPSGLTIESPKAKRSWNITCRLGYATPSPNSSNNAPTAGSKPFPF